MITFLKMLGVLSIVLSVQLVAVQAAEFESGVAVVRVVKKPLRFNEGFESPEWIDAWKLSKPPRNCVVIDRKKHPGKIHSGAKALRIRVEKGGHYGTSLDYVFKKVKGYEPEEVYFRYYLMLGENWDYHGKMPGFGGTYGKSGWGGRPSDGSTGWSARGSGHWDEEGFRLGTYCYHADMKKKYGNVWRWSGDKLQRGRWYCVEQFCKMNTPGENDGVIRAWVDGQKVFEKADIKMRVNPDLKIEKIWFNVYFGGKDKAPKECFLYIDDVVISDSYIGPSSE